MQIQLCLLASEHLIQIQLNLPQTRVNHLATSGMTIIVLIMVDTMGNQFSDLTTHGVTAIRRMMDPLQTRLFRMTSRGAPHILTLVATMLIQHHHPVSHRVPTVRLLMEDQGRFHPRHPRHLATIGTTTILHILETASTPTRHLIARCLTTLLPSFQLRAHLNLSVTHGTTIRI